jgi:hypothetical protein
VRPIVTALFAIVFFTVISAGFVYLAARALILKFDGAVAIAEVTDTPYIHHDGHSYAVRYRFQVPGSARWYEHEEPMLAGKPRASVRQDTWLAARKTGTIRVVYARHHPSLNLPEAASPLDGLLCTTTGAVIMGLLALGSVLAFRDQIRGRRRIRKKDGNQLGSPTDQRR